MYFVCLFLPLSGKCDYNIVSFVVNPVWPLAGHTDRHRCGSNIQDVQNHWKLV